MPGQPASRPDLPLWPRVPFGMSDLGDMPNMGSKTCLHLQAAFNSGGTYQPSTVVPQMFIAERDLLGGCLFLVIIYTAGFLCVFMMGNVSQLCLWFQQIHLHMKGHFLLINFKHVAMNLFLQTIRNLYSFLCLKMQDPLVGFVLSFFLLSILVDLIMGGW